MHDIFLANGCKDYDYDSKESPVARSPQSRDLAAFEAYSRTELPRLVETNLQAMVNAEIAPLRLEERMRAMVVDIVRRCQSTLAQNFDRIRSSRAVNNDAPQVESSPTALWSRTENVIANGLLTSLETFDTIEGPMQHTDHTPSMFFDEPPFLGAEAAALDLGLNDPFFLTSGLDDSGYGSFFSFSQGSHTNKEPGNKDYSESCGLIEGDDVPPSM